MTESTPDPIMAMHGMGNNIKMYGADHVVWEQTASGGLFGFCQHAVQFAK